MKIKMFIEERVIFNHEIILEIPGSKDEETKKEEKCSNPESE